jgi:DNA invertase Pin-like site-specific DNA recombinase
MDMHNTTKKKCAIYLRVSTDKQTVANQRPDLVRLAAARGLEIVAEYIDVESAAKPRDDYERLMLDAKRAVFDVVLIWAIDRFGRDDIGTPRDIRELGRVSVSLISFQEPWLDTTEPMARDLLIHVFTWLGRQERLRRSQRTKAGLARVRAHGSKSGRPIGRPPRFDAAGLAHVRALRSAGRSVRSIAMAVGVPRPTVQRALGKVLQKTERHRPR